MEVIQRLVQARNIIKRGWAKHILNDTNGNRCALGAMMISDLDHTGQSMVLAWQDAKHDEVFMA